MSAGLAVLGIDISKRSMTVCLQQGQQRDEAQFENTAAGAAALLDWLAQHGVEQVHACLEATGRYGLALASSLVEAGQRVSLLNPKTVATYAETLGRRSKTDRLDARVLADYGQRFQPPLWSPPDPARERLRQLSRYRSALLKQRQQARNRLQAGALDPFVERALQHQLVFLAEQLAELDQEVARHLAAHPALAQQHALLDSLPGLGAQAATAVLAELPPLDRLRHPGELVAYAGVDPSQQQSGTSVRKRPAISKRGNARLRTALFFPAMTAMRHCALLQPFVQRLRHQGLAPKAIVLAVARKLLRWIFGVLKHQRPFDPAYLLAAPPSS